MLSRYFPMLFLFMSVTFGCSTVPKESPKGKAVQVIKGPFAKTCTQLGRYMYNGTPFIHDKELMIILKEDAAQRNGNAIRLDTFTPGVTGVSNAKGVSTIFKCNPEKLRAYIRKQEKNATVDEESPSDDDFADDFAEEEAAPPPKSKAKKRVKNTD